MENPYSPPKSADSISTYVDGNEGYQIVGNKIISHSPLALPDCCVKCAADTEESDRLNKTIYWASPAIYLLILINLLVLAIVYFIIRKKGTVQYGFCQTCYQKLKKTRIFTTIAWVATVGVIITAINLENGSLGIVALALFIMSIVLTHFSAYPVKISSHRKGEFTFAGFSEQYIKRIDV